MKSDSIIIIGGFGILGTFAIAAFSMAIAIAVAVLIALGAGSWAGWLIYQRVRADQYRMRSAEIDLERQRVEVQGLRRKNQVVSVVGGNGAVAVSDVGGGDWQTIQPVLRAPVIPGMMPAPGKPEPPVEIPAPAPAQELLPILEPLDRIAIFGGMGTGKSSLLKHLLVSRAARSETYIVDSHAAPDTWPEQCRVIGMGRDYEQIEEFIIAICREMDGRYKALSGGRTAEGQFPPMCVVIDEATVLNQFCNVSEQMKSLLCECRKVSIQLVISGQSDRVGALGLKGAGDLKAGFEAVVYLEKAADGRRYGRVFMGYEKEAMKCLHPGPFHAPVRGPGAGGHGGFHGGFGPGPDRPGDHQPGPGPEPQPVGYPEIIHQPVPDFESAARQAIYDALYHASEPLSPKKIEAVTSGLDGGYIRKTLAVMAAAGHVRKVKRGQFTI